MSEVSENQDIEKKGITRRSFLKILGGTSAATAVGCADSPRQNIFPSVKSEEGLIPGVAVWYNSTCTECPAGCGIQVRTREGRAVKVEGNAEHPINQGGLCGLGQASLQNLYDPDRVRQPLKKVKNGSEVHFEPISWDEAYAQIAERLKDKGKKRGFISTALSGANADLLSRWCESFGADWITYDPMETPALAKAAELVFGNYGVPTYSFDRAEVVINFGADFLETWVSPVEHARSWSRSRKSDKPLRLVQIEPRASLTAAKSDNFFCCKPGSETQIAMALIKVLLDRGRGQDLREEVRARLEKLVAGVTIESAAEASGLTKENILLAAQYLSEAKLSLVIAGGSAAQTPNPMPLYIAVNFLNLILSNVGETVHLARVRKPQTSLSRLAKLIEGMDKGELDTLFVYNSNPAFSLPASFNFRYAIKKVAFVVSFSSQLDETARNADLILPAHHSLESWGETRPVPGVYNLIQPVMRAVFDTRGFGDMLLGLATSAGASSVGDGAADFQAYIKASWRKVHSEVGGSEAFEAFWLKAVEQGGVRNAASDHARLPVRVNDAAFEFKFDTASITHSDVGPNNLILYPYFSVKGFDGRSANRPWLQELPDPISQLVWDSWAEIHPDTAKENGIAQGDIVTVRNHWGEMNVPAYITPYVHREVVAVPIGQGHTSYGRFADKVGANVFDMLPALIGRDSDSLALVSAKVKISRSRIKEKIVAAHGSDSQMGRDIAKTTFLGGTAHEAASHKHAHAEPKQMYTQREHPLYQWAMAVDLAACTGCSACVVACYAENNIPVVGKEVFSHGRELSWLRIERYHDGSAEELQVSFIPMMCQQCGSAPCEPVCPVYATYHNEEGLNVMVYNRCVGTRYCSNNCPYKVRRFNWFQFDAPEPLNWQYNPDVTPRNMGVMEKCTFCVQRINEAKDRAKDIGRTVADGEVKPACVQGCPTQALTFGNLKDPGSAVSHVVHHERSYKVLDHHINTQPAVTYLNNVRYKV